MIFRKFVTNYYSEGHIQKLLLIYQSKPFTIQINCILYVYILFNKLNPSNLILHIQIDVINENQFFKRVKFYEKY